MAGAAPHLTVSGSRFYCHWFCLVSVFVFDVVPVIPYAPLCQAWLLHPVLPSAGLGLIPWCQLPTAGARSQLLGWLPSSPCPRAPRLLSGQARPSYWGLLWAQSGGHCVGTHSEPVLVTLAPCLTLALHRITVSPQLVLGRASTEMQGSCCKKSVYDSVLRHWRFIFFTDILDTSRVISEDGKKKVGAVL